MGIPCLSVETCTFPSFSSDFSAINSHQVAAYEPSIQSFTAINLTGLAA
jgi:hypothetical protein